MGLREAPEHTNSCTLVRSVDEVLRLIPLHPVVQLLEKTHLKTFFCPLFTQDLFFKYTWNNFLHFQVELCIAAILSHAAREEQAEASGSDGKVEPLQGSGDGTGKPETPQSITSLPENTMVTHVSPVPLFITAS